MSFKRKLFIFAAPSGAGKTTIVRHLLKTFDQLAFSVSATSRPPRSHEIHGKDYYFYSVEKFRQLIDEDAFIEWEEVYKNQFYGTLKKEVLRLWANDKHVIFDIDVKGALNIKQKYPNLTLTVFIKPPSFEALSQRLEDRNTESEKELQKRLGKANFEMSFENQFDKVLVNDNLEVALQKAETIINVFVQ